MKKRMSATSDHRAGDQVTAEGVLTYKAEATTGAAGAARVRKSTRPPRACARSEPSTLRRVLHWSDLHIGPGSCRMDSVDGAVDRDDPVRVRSDIDAPSRRPLVAKRCALAVPHDPILIGLYLLYPLVTIAAGIAIVFTGRIRVRSSTSMSGSCAGRGDYELPLSDEQHRQDPPCPLASHTA